jgi:hypothetical protein
MTVSNPEPFRADGSDSTDGTDAGAARAEPANSGDRRGACLICGAPTHSRYRPFCSKRCADVDLGRWFGEHYTIPVQGGADGWSDESETG